MNQSQNSSQSHQKTTQDVKNESKNQKRCADSGELQKQTSRCTDSYFNTFGAGGGYIKK